MLQETTGVLNSSRDIEWFNYKKNSQYFTGTFLEIKLEVFQLGHETFGRNLLFCSITIICFMAKVNFYFSLLLTVPMGRDVTVNCFSYQRRIHYYIVI